LDSATDVLVLPSGNLIALDGINGVVEVDPLTGAQTHISDFTNADQGPTALFVYGIAREATGHYLVTDNANLSVQFVALVKEVRARLGTNRRWRQGLY
jgi:hypothetical protein